MSAVRSYARGMEHQGWRAWAQRVRDVFPLTNLGLLVAGGAAAAHFGFALGHADYALQIVAVMSLALVALALLVVLLGALALHLRLRELDAGDALRFEANRGFARGLTVRRQRWLVLLEVNWSWIDPEGVTVRVEKEGGELQEVVEATGRVHAERVVRRFTLEDGFGLARIVLQHRQSQRVDVVPWTGRLEESPLEATLASGDGMSHPRGDPTGDRVDMRRYSPGDPLRLVLWKIYARTGELMVRTREHAVSPDVRVAAYLPSCLADEPAAAAARVALHGGLLGPEWVFGADGQPSPLDEVGAAEAAIVSSRSRRGQPEADAAGLGGFVAQALGSSSGRLLVFVPGQPGPWLQRVLATCRRRPGGVTAVVVVDGVANKDKVAPARRWFMRPPPPDPTDEAVVSPDELNEVSKALARAGADVLVLDRPSGRALGAGLQDMLRKKAA